MWNAQLRERVLSGQQGQVGQFGRGANPQQLQQQEHSSCGSVSPQQAAKVP